VSFEDGSPVLPSRSTGGGDRGAATITTLDIDKDGDLDLAESSRAGLGVLQNDGKAFVDATMTLLGPLANGPATAALAGDYDNDGQTDLAVLRPSGITLLRRDGARFSDVTASAELTPAVEAPKSAAWLDVDHDGDLDLFVAGGAESTPVIRLFHNNGNGPFTNVASEAGVTSRALVHAVVPTDFDNRR